MPLSSNKDTMRVLFYYHHFGGLGHGMRIYSICKAAKELCPAYKLLVINSGPPQPELDIKRYAEIVNLPPFKARKGLFSGLSSERGPHVTFSRRKKILNLVADTFRPNLAIFEHFPLGRDSLEGEITEFIKYLKKDNVIIYSSVRDIIDQESDVAKIGQRLSLFDGVLVHSDKKMGLKADFMMTEELKRKMVLTGRVYPISREEMAGKRHILDKLGCNGRKLIVISIGGGIDGFGIIKEMVKIKKEIDKKIKTFYLISTGPSFPRDYFNKLRQLAEDKNEIVFKKFITGFPGYINAANLYISMGGYNSINNAIFTGTKTLIFPRQNDNEQAIRAKYYSRLLTISDYRQPRRKLASEIISILKKDNSVNNRLTLKGAIITARLINRILSLNYIKVRLTTECNCSCDMCSWKTKTEELSFSVVKRLLDQAKLLNIKTISFTGGEPTLHKEFYNLIGYVKKHGFSLSVSTNGNIGNKGLVYLSKFADFVDISLNSHKEELDDKIKGKTGAFMRSMHSIINLNKLSKNIKIHVNVTVRPDNLRDINKIVPFLSKYIHSISFTLIDISMNKLKYLRPSKEQLLYFYFVEVPLILKECINNGVEVKITPFFKEFPAFSDNQKVMRSNKYYAGKLKSVFQSGPSEDCEIKRKQLRINSDGEVSPCCYLDDYPVNLGNIYNEGLIDIVTSDKYFDFISSAKPDISCRKRCNIGYKIYSEYF
ncbi:MAG: radical SAM protein [Candidatus Omnitrophota bacterium]